MNRRGVALVVVVVLAIGFGAWWLSSLPVEVNSSPPAPIAERVEVQPPPPIQPPPPEPVVMSPPRVLAEPDAGMLAELEIEVVQNGEQLIGVRVELEGPGGRVSRPTDVMGFARFTLPTGSWRITEPALPERIVPYDGGSYDDWAAAIRRTTTAPIEVTAPLTRYRHLMPTLGKFRIRVVDERNQPVIGAEIGFGGFGISEKKFSDHRGELTVETTAEVLQVQARSGSRRSMLRTATAKEVTTLVLEEWTQLKVDTTPTSGGCLYVRVMYRDEVVAVGCFSESILVPVGNLSVLARRNIKGSTYSGRARTDTKAGIENVLEIALSPTPPITGRLVDATGQPMPGLQVLVRLVQFVDARDLGALEAQQHREPILNAVVRRDGGFVGRFAGGTRTNRLGEFSWAPGVGGGPDPIFQVMVVGLWQTKADPVLVKLDDAPLEIEVEPAHR